MSETVTITKPAPILEGSLTAFLSQIDKLSGGALDPRLDPSKFTTVTDPDTGKQTQIFRGIDTSKYDPKVADQVKLQTDAAAAAAQLGTLVGPDAYKDFMSPYQQEVIDTTLAEFDRQQAIQRSRVSTIHTIRFSWSTTCTNSTRRVPYTNCRLCTTSSTS
jgi:hypothetical protein